MTVTIAPPADMTRRERLLLYGAPGSGKALAHGEPVLTIDGWVPIEEISVGDRVIGSDGQPIRVTHVHPQGVVNLFRVSTREGTDVVTCGDHLWTVTTRSNRDHAQTVDTRTIQSMLKDQETIYLPESPAVRFVSRDTVLDPWTLGALLGDGGFSGGSASFTNSDGLEHHLVLPEGVAVRDKAMGQFYLVGAPYNKFNPLKNTLMWLGLWGKKSVEKFVPAQYKWGLPEVRFQVLAGLMDTDGSVEGNSCVYSTSSRQLAEDVRFIVWSLGGSALMTKKDHPTYSYKGEKRTGQVAYRIIIRLPDGQVPFLHCARKVEARASSNPAPWVKRKIVEVATAGVGEATCITVDAEDGLFIARDFVLTHNSLAYQRILAATQPHVQFYVIDTDGGWEPAAASEEFAPHADRVHHFEPEGWVDYMDAIRTSQKEMDRDRGDWLVVDLADQAWTEVQDWWHEKKYGDDWEAAIDDDNEDPMNKWGTINKAYAPFAKALIRVPGNVLVCATEKELKKDGRGNYFRESRTDIRDFGGEGTKPGGQKKLSHDVNTVLHMKRMAKSWEMSVIKDRNRMKRWGEELTRTVADFPLDFLCGVAGWLPVVDK